MYILFIIALCIVVINEFSRKYKEKIKKNSELHKLRYSTIEYIDSQIVQKKYASLEEMIMLEIDKGYEQPDHKIYVNFLRNRLTKIRKLNNGIIQR